MLGGVKKFVRGSYGLCVQFWAEVLRLASNRNHITIALQWIEGVIGAVLVLVFAIFTMMVFVSALVDYFRPLDPVVALTPTLRSADGDMFRLDELGNPRRIPNADRSEQWPSTPTESNATGGDEFYDGDDDGGYREKPKILRKLRSLSVILESVRTFSLLIYLCKKIVCYVYPKILKFLDDRAVGTDVMREISASKRSAIKRSTTGGAAGSGTGLALSPIASPAVRPQAAPNSPAVPNLLVPNSRDSSSDKTSGSSSGSGSSPSAFSRDLMPSVIARAMSAPTSRESADAGIAEVSQLNVGNSESLGSSPALKGSADERKSEDADEDADDEEDEYHSVESSILRAREEQRRQLFLAAQQRDVADTDRENVRSANIQTPSSSSFSSSFSDTKGVDLASPVRTSSLFASSEPEAEAGESKSEIWPSSSDSIFVGRKVGGEMNDVASLPAINNGPMASKVESALRAVSHSNDKLSLSNANSQSSSSSPPDVSTQTSESNGNAGETDVDTKSVVVGADVSTISLSGLNTSSRSDVEATEDDTPGCSSQSTSDGQASGTGIEEHSTADGQASGTGTGTDIDEHSTVISHSKSEVISPLAASSSSVRSAFSLPNASYDSSLTEQLRLSSLRRRRGPESESDSKTLKTPADDYEDTNATSVVSSSPSAGESSPRVADSNSTNPLRRIGSLSSFTQSVSSRMTSLASSLSSSTKSSRSNSRSSSKRPSFFESFKLVKQTVDAAPHDPIANMGALVHNRVLSFLSDTELAKVQRTSREWYLAVESPTLWDALLPTLGIDYAELNVRDDYKTMTDEQQAVVLERHIVEMPNCPSHWTERHVTSFCSRYADVSHVLLRNGHAYVTFANECSAEFRQRVSTELSAQFSRSSKELHTVLRFKKEQKDNTRSYETHNRKADEIFLHHNTDLIIGVLFIPLMIHMFPEIKAGMISLFGVAWEFVGFCSSSVVTLGNNVVTLQFHKIPGVFDELDGYLSAVILFSVKFGLATTFFSCGLAAVGTLYVVATRSAPLARTRQRLFRVLILSSLFVTSLLSWTSLPRHHEYFAAEEGFPVPAAAGVHQDISFPMPGGNYTLIHDDGRSVQFTVSFERDSTEFMASYAREGESHEAALARFAGEKMLQAADDPELFRLPAHEAGMFESMWETLSATYARMQEDAVFDGVTFFTGILLYLFISMVPLTMFACVWAARTDRYYQVVLPCLMLSYAAVECTFRFGLLEAPSVFADAHRTPLALFFAVARGLVVFGASFLRFTMHMAAFAHFSHEVLLLDRIVAIRQRQLFRVSGMRRLSAISERVPRSHVALAFLRLVVCVVVTELVTGALAALAALELIRLTGYIFVLLVCVSLAFLIPFYPTVALVAWGLEAVYVLPRLGRAFLENSANVASAAAARGGAAAAAGANANANQQQNQGAAAIAGAIQAQQGAAAAGGVVAAPAGAAAGGGANNAVAAAAAQLARPVHQSHSAFLNNFVSQQHVRYPRVYLVLSLLLPVVACFAHYDMNMNRLALDHKHWWPDILFYTVAALWTPLWYIN